MSERNARLLRKWVREFKMTEKVDLDAMRQILTHGNRYERRRVRRGLLRGLGIVIEPKAKSDQLPRNRR